MSWTTIIWSMTASACLTLAAIYFLVWCRRRTAWADLLFSLTSVGVTAYTLCELAMMRATTPAQFAAALSWLQVPTWVIVVSLVGFVRLQLRAGRPWLGWTVFALRTSALVLNFFTGQNLNFREVTGLRQVPFLGETASLGVGVSNPWMLVGQLSLLLLVVFTVDAAITVWRRGDRRQALVTGGSIAFFALTGMVQAVLVLWRIVDLPLTESFFFLGIVVAMGYEMSRETLRAAQLSDDLRESELRLKLAANSADVGLWSWDLKTNLIWATERARKLYDFSSGEPISLEKFLAKLHPDDRGGVAQAAQKVAQEGADFHNDYRVVLPDGNLRWLKVRAKAVLTPAGKPERVTGVSLDITEQKRTEEANRNAQALMSAVFNSVPGLLYLYTEDGRLIQWNRQHEKMTGYSSEELLNFRAKDWFDESNWVEAGKTFARVFAEGYAQTEVTMNLKNGEQMPIFATGSRLMIDGKPHMVGIALDTSARKKAEEKFRLMAEASPNCIVLADREGRMVLVNVQTESLFGYSREELIGQTVEMLMPERFRTAHAGERAGFMTLPEARAMGTGRELFALRKDGTEFPVEIGLSPIRSEEGILILAVIVDITARRQSEAEASRQRAELAHVSRVSVMGELSASMAHELNQPLTAILSNTQAAQRFLAADKLDPVEFGEILKDIVHDTTRARDVIRHLRALVKKSEREFVRVDVNEIIGQVVGFLHGDIVGRNVIVIRKFAHELPLVLGDRIQLQQVLLNLLLNAFDAVSGNHVPDRRVTVLTSMESAGMVSVAVRDSGVGIPPEKLEKIFQPFYTTKTEGLGMGLSVSRSIIESHGGRLSGENNHGPGATFSFTLPVAEQK